MIACPRCTFANIEQSMYCEHCGALLRNEQTSLETQWRESIPPPPPPLEYITPSQPMAGYSSYPQPLLYQPEIVPSGKGGGIIGTSIQAILYIISVSIAAFGLFGALAPSGNGNAAIALLCGFCLLVVGIIVLILLLIRRRVPLLRWWQRILGWVVVSVAALIIAIAQNATIGISSSNVVSNFLFGTIVCVYGLCLATLALW